MENCKDCPRCGSIDPIKNGKSRTGIQRFKCAVCLKRFQVDRASRKSQLSNAEILELKEKGLSLSKIAALAGVSKNAIAKRLKRRES